MDQDKNVHCLLSYNVLQSSILKKNNEGETKKEKKDTSPKKNEEQHKLSKTKWVLVLFL